MKNIRKYRGELGYTQNELAMKLGVSRQTVNSMENDPDYVISDKTLRKITELFDCGIYDVCNLENSLMYKPLTLKDKESLERSIREYGRGD